MSTPQMEPQPKVKDKPSPEEMRKRLDSAMTFLKEHMRLSKNPLTEKQMRQIRFTLNRDWEKAQQMEAEQRHETMFNLLFERFHFLNNHFLAWEEERENDRRWKEEIEATLDKFLKDATGLLKTLTAQAQEIIEGSPESQGDMMKLILGNLNELRERVDNLENSGVLSKTSGAARRN